MNEDEMQKLVELANQKIEDTPGLDMPVISELIDWRNGEEQLRWFINASISEILDFTQSLKAP